MKKEITPLQKVRSLQLHLNKGSQHILLYGIAAASLIFGLKYLQWQFLMRDNAIDTYMGLSSLVFTLLGAWIAVQLMPAKRQTVKENKPPNAQTFNINEAALVPLELSAREDQILRLLVQGCSNAEIADELCLSLSTIKTHVSRLYAKLHVNSRFQAMALAKKLNILD